jgi:hypothetical protein
MVEFQEEFEVDDLGHLFEFELRFRLACWLLATGLFVPLFPVLTKSLVLLGFFHLD